MELVVPVQQKDLPLENTSTTAASPYATAPSGSNPFEVDLPPSSPTRSSNPFEFAPSSPTGRPSNPFMDYLAPSSPRRSIDPFDFYCHYSSAPASPARAAAIYAQFNSASADDNFMPRASFSTSSTVPFDWEEKPGTPKSRFAGSGELTSSPEFEFNAPAEKGLPPGDLTAADELFEEGRIRPLKPPPRLQLLAMDERSSVSVGSSPRSSPMSKSIWSPHRRNKADFDPFAAALVEATKEDRGREKKNKSSHARKESRSLSPLSKGTETFFDAKTDSSPAPPLQLPSPAGKSSATGKTGRKKWRLSDLLLFRSASEGRVTGNRSKDPIFKYSPVAIFNGSAVSPSPASEKKASGGGEETKKHIGLGLKGGNFFIKKTVVHGHDKQYVNGAGEEGKKKGGHVAYRQNVFSCIRLNPAMHRLARGINTYHLSRGKSG